MDFYKDTWYILDEYFKTSYFLTKHHLDSYNDFVSNKLINTIRVLNPFLVLKGKGTDNEHEINVYIGGKDAKEVYINKPTIFENGEQRPMYPNEARLRDMTYKSDIYAEIIVEYSINGDKITKSYGKLWIGSIPIMLHSHLCILHNQPPAILGEMGECIYDQGGYFIVDGKEKVIVAQERIVTNKIFINKSKDNKYSYEGLIRCTSEENPLFPKTMHLYIHRDRFESIKNNESTEEGEAEGEGEAEEGDEIEEEVRSKKSKHPNAIVISSPNISNVIPIFILFRALGVENDKDIIKMVVPDIEDPNNKVIVDFLRHSVIHGADMYSQEEALKYIANFVEYKHVDHVKHVLINDVFPNVGKEFRNKAFFLGHIVNKLIKVCLGINPESDRDSYIYKRVDISGFLLANLFRDYYNQFRQKVRARIENLYNYKGYKTQTKDISDLINEGNLNDVFQGNIVDEGLKKSLKGSWGINMVEEEQDMDDIKQELVQDLSRISYIGFMSHMRRVNTPIDPTSKIVAPHRLHPSQWGVMCPCESPDGASIGLLKNFAIMCNVTFDSNTQVIMDILKDKGVVMLNDIDMSTMKSSCKVLINNNWIGIHRDPESLFKILKLLKRNAIINIYTSISWDIINEEIHILTEAGRCCRPLYVIHDGKLLIEDYIEKIKAGKLSWNDLITAPPNKTDLEKNQSPIEFIDVEEANRSLIATDSSDLNNTMKKYTHCEIHSSTILSVVTHNIPLANHNQAPRNIFSGAQGKQAIGCYATNFNNRIDTMSYVLHYPQKCIVNTRYCEYLNLNRLPNGENLIVALATYSGYNMEDSIIINGDSIKRGMFNLTYFKHFVKEEEENKNDDEIITFGNPNTLIKAEKTVEELKWGDYSKLDVNGFPLLNKYIDENDAIVGMIKSKSELVDGTSEKDVLFGNKVKKEFYHDRTTIADKTTSGIVDKVFLNNKSDNLKTCKIRFRKMRLPELGDKCCCYDDETQILTQNGWVLFKDLMETDKVATLVGNELKYQKPKEIQKYDYDGKLYLIETKDVNLCVTPNHRMYVRAEDVFDIKLAIDIGNKSVHYKKNVEKWTTDLYKVPEFYVVAGELVGFKVGVETFNISEWLRFFGVWLAHGRQNVGASELNRYLSELPRDKFPEWVWHLKTHHARILATSILRQSNNVNMDDFQRLCLHAGLPEDDPEVHVDSTSWKQYCGVVWCCTVEEGDGILYVRRKGVCVWSGNSRHAQKGVIGMVIPQDNMPFTKDGIVPDIIINPHAIPSRMTVGHLLETLLGKVGVCQGTTIDGTPFNNNDYTDILNTLTEFKFEKYGNEIMYNGMTGTQMETSIFIGPTYYERLKHMVADKINYRQVNYRGVKDKDTGMKFIIKDAAVSATTRQPTKGRANNGGLRIGEMEKDSILSHGTVAFLKESLMERSDKFNHIVDGTKVSTPFAFKQLLHELNAMSIKAHLIHEDESD